MTSQQPKISNEELLQMIKDGDFFYFCVGDSEEEVINDLLTEFKKELL